MTVIPFPTAADRPDYLTPKATAKVVRRRLRAAFPGVKFSVRTARGSMVSAVDIRWTDGPTPGAVDTLMSDLVAGRFDGMQDLYEYDRSKTVDVDGVTFRPGCRYVSTHRRHSYGAVSAALAMAVDGRFPGAACTPQGSDEWGWSVATNDPDAQAAAHRWLRETANPELT